MPRPLLAPLPAPLFRAFALASVLVAACQGGAGEHRVDGGLSASQPEVPPRDADLGQLPGDAGPSTPVGDAEPASDAALSPAPSADAGRGPHDAGRALPPLATALHHPGILSSAADLAFVRAEVAAGHAPRVAAFEALRASKYAKLDYAAQPFAVVECGSYNRPNVGCTPIVEDGMAVYAHSLLWAITQEQRHADKAIEVLDAWARTYEKNTESNARLVVAWAVPWYVNGAEILRYTGAGWSNEGIERFSAMLRKMLPYVQDDTRPENNWILSRIEAHLAIAVWMDDRKEFDAAVERFRFWLPIYLYQPQDGATPVIPPGRTAADVQRLWRGSAASTAYVAGLSMETCRDLGHVGLGFASMVYAAEIAYQQGVDLFADHRERITDFMELHGGFMTGTVLVPATICGGVVKAELSDTVGIAPPRGGGRKVWEIAYHHLHDRLAMALPFSWQMIQAGRPSGGNRWVEKWESLTHAGRPLPSTP